MPGTASSLLLTLASVANLASMALLSPATASPISSSRGTVADKRALQLQVFHKIIFMTGAEQTGGVTASVLP